MGMAGQFQVNLWIISDNHEIWKITTWNLGGINDKQYDIMDEMKEK